MSERDFPDFDGKIRSHSLCRHSSAACSTSMALEDNGTLCFTLLFMRSAGTVHTRDSKSISDHVARRASPLRAAVRTRNRKHNRVGDPAEEHETFSIAFGTSRKLSAGWCCFAPEFLGSTRVMFLLAGLSPLYPCTITQSNTAAMRCRTRFAVSCSRPYGLQDSDDVSRFDVRNRHVTYVWVSVGPEALRPLIGVLIIGPFGP